MQSFYVCSHTTNNLLTELCSSFHRLPHVDPVYFLKNRSPALYLVQDERRHKTRFNKIVTTVGDRVLSRFFRVWYHLTYSSCSCLECKVADKHNRKYHLATDSKRANNIFGVYRGIIISFQ